MKLLKPLYPSFFLIRGANKVLLKFKLFESDFLLHAIKKDSKLVGELTLLAHALLNMNKLLSLFGYLHGCRWSEK